MSDTPRRDGIDRRLFLKASLAGGALAALNLSSSCSSSVDGVPGSQIDAAVAQLDAIVANVMQMTGVPGMAVAVVRGDQTVYAKGFGVRKLGGPDPVDADTVFQLASVSKSVGASAVAQQVALGAISWDTRIVDVLPWFALSDATSTANVTLADTYAHRTGLPDHAGDRVEDLGYDQRKVLEQLRHIAVKPLGSEYAYTNFGMTAGGLAVAARAGTDWATLVEKTIYVPLGMTSSSSRDSDFQSRANRATGHIQVDGKWVVTPVPRMPDGQAPAASVTSSANDMAKWMAMMIGRGQYQGKRVVDATQIDTITSEQMQMPSGGFYGYGFNVGKTPGGRHQYNHSGAFGSGGASFFRVIPSMQLGLFVVANGWPIGAPELVGALFFDQAENGAPTRDWASIIPPGFAPFTTPEGSLVGMAPPAAPAPAQPNAAYVGTYNNDYWGPITVGESLGKLTLSMGPGPLQRELTHWDGDTFTFSFINENAPPGTISKATFGTNQVVLEYYDHEFSGTFTK